MNNRNTELAEGSNGEASDFERIVMCLQNEFTLTNRGTGWYLQPKNIPYKNQTSELISDEVVDKLKFDGVIRYEMPYNSCRAILNDINLST